MYIMSDIIWIYAVCKIEYFFFLCLSAYNQIYSQIIMHAQLAIGVHDTILSAEEERKIPNFITEEI